MLPVLFYCLLPGIAGADMITEDISLFIPLVAVLAAYIYYAVTDAVMGIKVNALVVGITAAIAIFFAGA